MKFRNKINYIIIAIFLIFIFLPITIYGIYKSEFVLAIIFGIFSFMCLTQFYNLFFNKTISIYEKKVYENAKSFTRIDFDNGIIFHRENFYWVFPISHKNRNYTEFELVYYYNKNKIVRNSVTRDTDK